MSRRPVAPGKFVGLSLSMICAECEGLRSRTRVLHSTCIERFRSNGKELFPLEIGRHAFLLAHSRVVIFDPGI